MANADVQNVAELEDKIIKQVEYYFGDLNLPDDKFLQKKLALDDGWVTVEVLLTFNKLRRLTQEANVVVDALRKSTSELLELSEDGTKVRRSLLHPLPDESERRQNIDELSVFVRGFPLTITVDELLQFFGQFGNCISVFKRRHPKTRMSVGSVYATFATKDEVDAFLAMKSVQYNGVELTRAIKQTHRAIRLKEDAEQEAIYGPPAEPQLVPGCLLRVTGLGENTERESLKQALASYAEVAFVDDEPAKGEAVVRFVKEGAANVVLAKLTEQEGSLTVDGNDVVVELLEGAEEVEYWKKLATIKLRLMNRWGRRRKMKAERRKKRRMEESEAMEVA
ncbi:hypothetical protein HPB50_025692 [Hyalomma asiaticum]|uniref:Uncharacterized protein n=1 Tax=Hyalomma asiaticum TaxID=266040 RepID=A0ACB7SI12_HYAAI|nr:hypothetical protein HPB50_025692 [Hyalomma asiaticum]